MRKQSFSKTLFNPEEFESVAINYGFRDGLVWTVGLTVGIKMRFSNSPGLVKTEVLLRNLCKADTNYSEGDEISKISSFEITDVQVSDDTLVLKFKKTIKPFKIF